MCALVEGKETGTGSGTRPRRSVLAKTPPDRRACLTHVSRGEQVSVLVHLTSAANF